MGTITELDGVTEQHFQEWYKKVAEKNKLNGNSDAAGHAYDFRGLFTDVMDGTIPEKSVMDGEFPCKHALEDNPKCKEEE